MFVFETFQIKGKISSLVLSMSMKQSLEMGVIDVQLLKLPMFGTKKVKRYCTSCI